MQIGTEILFRSTKVGLVSIGVFCLIARFRLTFDHDGFRLFGAEGLGDIVYESSLKVVIFLLILQIILAIPYVMIDSNSRIRSSPMLLKMPMPIVLYVIAFLVSMTTAFLSWYSAGDLSLFTENGNRFTQFGDFLFDFFAAYIIVFIPLTILFSIFLISRRNDDSI